MTKGSMMSSSDLHANGVTISIGPDRRGRRLLAVDPHERSAPRRLHVETTYPDALIQRFIDFGAGPWLADLIARDEDPNYVERFIRETITSFVSLDSLRGKRLLDFGCGTGASTVILGRMLPETTIVGIELDAELLVLAKARAAHHGLRNVSFQASPAPDALPPDVGNFDALYLSAVYEHLLPNERATLIPLLWSQLAPGGLLFIDETPWRWFPLELHSTRLPINYLPDRLAHWVARRARFTTTAAQTWTEQLRAGVRGTSRHEIQRNVGPTGRFLPPLSGSPVDVWWRAQDPTAYGRSKRLIYRACQALYALTGVVACPYLTLAMRKD
jgi:SAM-dependent methyltransferase